MRVRTLAHGAAPPFEPFPPPPALDSSSRDSPFPGLHMKASGISFSRKVSFLAALLAMAPLLHSCGGGGAGSPGPADGSAAAPGAAAVGTSGQSVVRPWTRDPKAPPPACVLGGYACAWSDVEWPAFERAVLLGQAAGERHRAGEDLASVADWLKRQPGVDWVEEADGILRFLAEGARPLGLVDGRRQNPEPLSPRPQTEATDAGAREDLAALVAGATYGPEEGWGEDSGTGWDLEGAPGDGDGHVSARSGPTREGGSDAPEARDGGARPAPFPGPKRVSSPPLPAMQASPAAGQVVSDNSDPSTKPLKRALILGPADWDFSRQETFGVEVQLRSVGNRDYACEDCITVRRSDFPRPQGSNVRCIPEPDGQCLPRFDTSWRDFLGWEQYDLIHVTTHGTQHCDTLGCRTFVNTGYQTGGGSMRDFYDRVTAIPSGSVPDGIEYLLHEPFRTCPSVREEPSGPRQTAFNWTDRPHDDVIRSENSEAHRVLCEPNWGEYVTADFFRDVYPDGLRDKIIVFNACQVFASDEMVRHLSSGRGTSILGWTIDVPSDDAARVAAAFYSKILNGVDGTPSAGAARKGGNRVVVAWEEATRYVRRDAGNPERFVVGPTRSARVSGGDLRPGQEESLDKRAVELVHLVEATEDREIRDGEVLTLRGAAADGAEDSLGVAVDVTGLAGHDDIDQFRVRFRMDGRELDGSFPLQRKVSEEVHRFEGVVPLGVDVRPGQRADLDVRVEIPGGGISRWLYEDLLLVGSCSFAGTIREVRFPAPRERWAAMAGDYWGRATFDGSGRLQLTIENLGDPRRDHGTPEVDQFTLAVTSADPDRLPDPLQPYRVAGALLDLTRPNRLHNQARSWNSTETLFTRFDYDPRQDAATGGAGPATLRVLAAGPGRMAGTVDLFLRRGDAVVRFEGAFDAGLESACRAR